MSRSRLLISSSIWGYLALAASIIYGLGSIPLALHYLSVKEFGLWIAIQQIVTYLMLVDFGMTSALARILIDRKGDPDPTAYGSTILTAVLVLAVQGVMVVAAGTLAAIVLPGALRVPEGMEMIFRNLMFAQTAIVAVGFLTKIFGQILYAHHRLDIQNAITILVFGCQFLALWWSFHLESGVFSLVWGGATSLVVGSIASAIAVATLGFFPKRKLWGAPSMARFREIFAYGTGLFLINIGNTLIFFTQTIIITRFIGLAEAGIWAVCTRTFMLLLTICWRPFDSSYTLFCEMISHHEQAHLYSRFRSMASFTLGCAAFAAVGFAACNQLFITVWTSGKVSWPVGNDILLGVWTLALTLVRCHAWLIQASKDLGFLRYIYFAEGVVFVSIGSLVANRGSYGGVIFASIGSTLIFTLPYVIWRSSRYLKIPVTEIIWEWSRGARYILLVLTPVAIALAFFPDTGSPIGNLVLRGSGLLLTSLPLIRYLFNDNMRAEIFSRLPQSIRPAAGYLLGRAATL